MGERVPPTQSLMLALVIVVGLGPFVPTADRFVCADQDVPSPTSYRSPLSLVVAQDGQRVYVTDHTAGNVSILDASRRARCGEVALRGSPHGVALAKGGSLYVSEHGAGSVAVINTAKRQVTSRIDVGRWPTGLAVAEASKRLFVCNQDSHSVSVVDLKDDPPREIEQIRVIREPSWLAITPDERHIVVANLLPFGPGTDADLAAEVSIIDGDTLEQAATVKLPPGSTLVQGVCVGPNGKWAYLVHGLGRFHLPITQLEGGWVNTYALTMIDIPNRRRLATVLLDDLTQGAANPHSIVCSPDGRRLWISHSGVHEISVIEIGRVHELLNGHVPEPLASLKDGTQPNIWMRIKHAPQLRAELENNLTALYIADAIERIPSGGLGPRGIAISPNESELYVANYYSGCVAILSTETGELLGRVSIGSQREPDAVRRGEIVFHDATLAFQRWHSCASCHPNQGRVDGLPWDFLRDGFGNGKDTPSLVLVAQTPPHNRLATRKDVRECARTGFTAGHMVVPKGAVVEDLLAYLVSLQADSNPHLASDGQLSAAAKRGKKLFNGKARCAECHPAPYYTDKRMHNVGVISPNEPEGRYDTPSLIECHRTSPYLHDGRAPTLREVFTDHDKRGGHGKASLLTDAELDDLVAFLRSL